MKRIGQTIICLIASLLVVGCRQRTAAGVKIESGEIETRVSIPTNGFFIFSNNLKYAIIEVKVFDLLPLRFREQFVTNLQGLSTSNFNDWQVAHDSNPTLKVDNEEVRIDEGKDRRAVAVLSLGVNNSSVAAVSASEIESIDISSLIFYKRRYSDEEVIRNKLHQIVK